MTPRPLWIRLATPIIIAQVALMVVVWLGVGGSWSALAWCVGALVVMMEVTIGVVRRHASELRALARAADRVTRGEHAPDGAAEGVERFAAQRSRELRALTDAVRSMAQQHAEQVALLRAQRNQQEAILQSMDGALIALGPEQHILWVNRSGERMLGVRASHAAGRLIQEAVREPELNDFINSALSGADTHSGEIRLVAHGPRVVRANSARLLDGRGEPVGIIILMTDITELRRLEQVRSDFAANVSHELRTPITNIKGYTETLLEGGDQDPALADRFLRTIQRNADQMEAIVEDLLLLTRLERPGDDTHLGATPTPASAIIAAARTRLDAEANSRGVAIDTEGDPGLMMMVNARLAEHGVFNLLANAVKFSAAGTRVRVTVRTTELDDAVPGVEIEVADDGPGIAPVHLPRLWERFYRVDRARTREQGGTGLGLSIVRHIAVVHGGRVSVSSVPGRGSHFRIAFPAAGIARGGERGEEGGGASGGDGDADGRDISGDGPHQV